MPHNYAPEHLKKWKEQLLQASVHTARYTYVHECLKKKLVIEANGTCNTINLCKSQPQISFCKQRNQHPKKTILTKKNQKGEYHFISKEVQKETQTYTTNCWVTQHLYIKGNFAIPQIGNYSTM